MEYISTRGDMSRYQASDAIIKGLADDGGLFVPESLPAPYKSPDDLRRLEGLDYKQLAFEIMGRFLTDFTDDELSGCINNAYDDKFDDDFIAPLVKSGGVYFLELFHGRTLAFKDMALSILPYLMKTAMKKKNIDKKVLVLTATSGDTGKAAMEGFKDIDGISVIVFYPQNGVSKVQERQMTTQQGKNVTAVAVEGNFDDCQSAVKAIFADKEFEGELLDKAVVLSSANSINIGRLIPQVVYYFYGYFQLVSGGRIKLGDGVNFCVPTGNFGNILAGWYAKKMGLPVQTLICASNENNVLSDFFLSGEYDANRSLKTTSSPSMDIIISSNLERLLFHLSGAKTDKLMESLKATGVYGFDKDMLRNGGFYGEYATEDECLSAIAEMFDQTGYIMDTHTAVAYHCLKAYIEQTGENTNSIITSTASPYKFAGSVMKAVDPAYKNLNELDLLQEIAYLLAEDVPEQIKDLESKEVLHSSVCKKEDVQAFVRNYI